MKRSIALFICLFMLILTFSACSNEVEAPTMEIGYSTASSTAKFVDGEARFNVIAPKDGMYDFLVGEENADEWECSFYLLDENGEKITGDIRIHSTEWSQRSVFLPKGNYTLVAFGGDLKKRVNCSIDTVVLYEDNEVVLKQDGEISAPTMLGFNALNSEERAVKITLDGTQEKLVFDAYGTGSYYDYSQQFTLKIIDEKGNAVLQNPDDSVEENTFEGNYHIDVTGLKGEYTAYIQANDSCVITVEIR